MIIRPEEPKDYREVEELTREAFWNVYRPGCVEHYVLNQYRNSPDFVKELDFVMEEEGRIIGHVMFSKAELEIPGTSPRMTEGETSPRMTEGETRISSWTFGPISIHPDYKRKGYGLKLLSYALEQARKIGVGFLCMEGNIDFYKHVGFKLACTYNINYHGEPEGAEVPYFLAQELIPGWLAQRGLGPGGNSATYCPPKCYFVAYDNPDAFEAYEATFPPKEKLRLPGQLGI
jgi:predicted N-acetyltransferase YhbS